MGELAPGKVSGVDLSRLSGDKCAAAAPSRLGIGVLACIVHSSRTAGSSACLSLRVASSQAVMLAGAARERGCSLAVNEAD